MQINRNVYKILLGLEWRSLVNLREKGSSYDSNAIIKLLQEMKHLSGTLH